MKKNWVELRVFRENALKEGAPNVWSHVRSAIQNACDTYNQHYSRDPSSPDVDCKLDNETRVIIRARVCYPTCETTEELIVELRDTDIECVSDSDKRTFQISSDEQRAFVKGHGDIKELSADEVSRLILEPLFFKGQPKHPLR